MNKNAVFILKALNDDWQFNITENMIVGRGAQCDEVLEDGQASRQHARLNPIEQGIEVTDLNSTNGTFINDQRISGTQVAKPGDQLRFDTFAFEVVLIDPEQPATAEQPFDGDATIINASSPHDLIEQADAAKAAPEKANAPELSQQRHTEPQNETNAPASWAFQGQNSVDGTQILTADMLKDLNPDLSNPGSLPPALTDHAINQPTLIGLDDPIEGMQFELTTLSGKSNQWNIGRHENCEILINHPSVSMQHAQIINEGLLWKLVDQLSANGTYVNSVKGRTAYLQHGDQITIGQVKCEFLLGDQESRSNHTSPASETNQILKSVPTLAKKYKLMVISFLLTGLAMAALAWLVDSSALL